MIIHPRYHSGLLHLLGVHYWAFSLLPAVVGTTLPFWLKPPGFAFKSLEAIMFMLLIILGHTGYFLIYRSLRDGNHASELKWRRVVLGVGFIMVGAVIGWILNGFISFHDHVPGYIFLIYGFCALFTGMLYVIPPFSFYRHLFGEVVISVGLGLLPVLGAYLVQAGDITRTVYLAAFPVVVSTGLCVWISGLINREKDKKLGFRTTVMYFPERFANRYITLTLTITIYLSLFLVIISGSALSPLSLVAFLSIYYVRKGLIQIWKNYENKEHLIAAWKYALMVHHIICIVIIMASLFSFYFDFN